MLGKPTGDLEDCVLAFFRHFFRGQGHQPSDGSRVTIATVLPEGVQTARLE